MRTSEHQEQVTLFRWLAIWSQTHIELSRAFAIPNGGHRHKAVAGKMKAEGVRAGIPDIFLPVARNGQHGLFIELKTKTGRLSEPQIYWQEVLVGEGFAFAVCRGWQEAAGTIAEYLGIPKIKP